MNGYEINGYRKFNGYDISKCVYGLKRMNSESEEVRQLLVEITNQINSCKETYSPSVIGSIFFGLQKMNSDDIAVRSMCQALHEKIVASSGNPKLSQFNPKLEPKS